MKESEVWRKIAEKGEAIGYRWGLCKEICEIAWNNEWGLLNKRLNSHIRDQSPFAIIGGKFCFPVSGTIPPRDIIDNDVTLEEATNARILAAYWMALEAEEEEEKFDSRESAIISYQGY